MALINEKILLNYLHEIEYNNDALNAIGATNDTTGLRVIETPSDAATKYVKKFGNAYTITDISAGSVTVPRSDGGGVNKWWYEFYDFDTHTLMATVKDENGASAFVKGATLAGPASGMYVKVVWVSGTVSIADADRVRVTTDIDAGGRNIRLSAESFASGERLFYFAYSSSSYYMDSVTDQSAMYGGYRVAGGGSLRQPYYNIQEAIDAVAAAGAPFDNVTVLDSETYGEDIDCDVAGIFVQAALGQTPLITRGIGARITREVAHDGNNGDTAYVSKTGSDGNTGRWQDPYLTIRHAFLNRGGRTHINIKDSEIYEEVGAGIIFTTAMSLEPIYGQTPAVEREGTAGIRLQHIAASVYGMKMKCTGVFTVGIEMAIALWAGNVKDNTTYGNYAGMGTVNTMNGANISRNLCYDNTRGIQISQIATSSATIEKNILRENSETGLYITLGTGGTVTHTVQNNLIYLNTSYGLLLSIGAGVTWEGIIENNTITQNGLYGFYHNDAGVDNGDYLNNIIYNNTTYDLYRAGNQPTITNSNYGTNAPAANDWAIGGGCITSDPRFCKITAPYKFGLSANSEAIKADSVLDDMGAHLRCVEINNSAVTLNGFFIDGQSVYNEAVFIVDVINHIGTIIKWNSIRDFQGIGLDPYDNDVDTDCVITNNKIYNNGNGIKLSRGGNIVQENLIYNNTIYGIWSDHALQEFTHNTFYGNQYGLYLETVSSGITIRDNIFSGNSLYDIYSEIVVTPTYCCIEGAVTSNVNTTSGTNKLTDPLFVDAVGTDFNIKVIEGGYLIDSPCREAASDSKDIGAWDMARSIAEESWRKYQLAWNPRKLDPEYNGKGVTKFENAVGFTKMFEKGHLRVLPFQWSRTQASTEKLWKKIQYLSSLVPDRDQGRTADQCRIRVNPLPVQLILSGTAATISAATKTILDTNLDLEEDERKGYWASIKFLSGTGMTIDAALKTGTVTGSPWTVNEHVGRYQHLHGNYYVVKSNTVNAVTLSDPRDTLVNEITAWAFEKYFKMIKTENQILHLEDDDGELPTGSYDYYVDFIEMHVVKPTFKTLQERFYWLQETWKTGFSLFLEEI